MNRIFRYICSHSPERFCRPETTIHNDYENRISIFIIPVAFHNRLYVKHPPDRQGATLRLDPAAAFARRADRRRRLQSRRIGSGGRQPRKGFEPTPRQYVALNRSKLVFNVGLIDFEQNLLRDFPDREKLVNLSRGIRLLEGSCAHGHTHEPTEKARASEGHAHGIDPHIWTSPRALKQMAANAYDALRTSFPDSVRYTENYEKLLVRLDSLDTACAEALRQADVHTIVIYHPALTYYAADYGLEQLAVEHDGKEPSARHLARLIEEARRKKVRRVFYQAQYPASTVKVIAEDIGARSVKIDPLREDVIENIGEITRQLTSGNE